MHFPENDVLRNNVQDNRDRHQVSDRCQRALQKIHPVRFVKEQPREKGRVSRGRAPDAVAYADNGRENRLQNEPQPPGAGKPRQGILKKLAGEQVRIAGRDDFLNRARQCSQQNRER